MISEEPVMHERGDIDDEIAELRFQALLTKKENEAEVSQTATEPNARNQTPSYINQPLSNFSSHFQPQYAPRGRGRGRGNYKLPYLQSFSQQMASNSVNSSNIVVLTSTEPNVKQQNFDQSYGRGGRPNSGSRPMPGNSNGAPQSYPKLLLPQDKYAPSAAENIQDNEQKSKLSARMKRLQGSDSDSDDSDSDSSDSSSDSSSSDSSSSSSDSSSSDSESEDESSKGVKKDKEASVVNANIPNDNKPDTDKIPNKSDGKANSSNEVRRSEGVDEIKNKSPTHPLTNKRSSLPRSISRERFKDKRRSRSLSKGSPRRYGSRSPKYRRSKSPIRVTHSPLKRHSKSPSPWKYRSKRYSRSPSYTRSRKYRSSYSRSRSKSPLRRLKSPRKFSRSPVYRKRSRSPYNGRYGSRSPHKRSSYSPIHKRSIHSKSPKRYRSRSPRNFSRKSSSLSPRRRHYSKSPTRFSSRSNNLSPHKRVSNLSPMGRFDSKSPHSRDGPMQLHSMRRDIPPLMQNEISFENDLVLTKMDLNARRGTPQNINAAHFLEAKNRPPDINPHLNPKIFPLDGPPPKETILNADLYRRPLTSGGNLDDYRAEREPVPTVRGPVPVLFDKNVPPPNMRGPLRPPLRPRANVPPQEVRPARMELRPPLTELRPPMPLMGQRPPLGNARPPLLRMEGPRFVTNQIQRPLLPDQPRPLLSNHPRQLLPGNPRPLLMNRPPLNEANVRFTHPGGPPPGLARPILIERRLLPAPLMDDPDQDMLPYEEDTIIEFVEDEFSPELIPPEHFRGRGRMVRNRGRGGPMRLTSRLRPERVLPGQPLPLDSEMGDLCGDFMERDQRDELIKGSYIGDHCFEETFQDDGPFNDDIRYVAGVPLMQEDHEERFGEFPSRTRFPPNERDMRDFEYEDQPFIDDRHVPFENEREYSRSTYQNENVRNISYSPSRNHDRRMSRERLDKYQSSQYESNKRYGTKSDDIKHMISPNRSPNFRKRTPPSLSPRRGSSYDRNRKIYNRRHSRDRSFSPRKLVGQRQRSPNSHKRYRERSRESPNPLSRPDNRTRKSYSPLSKRQDETRSPVAPRKYQPRRQSNSPNRYQLTTDLSASPKRHRDRTRKSLTPKRKHPDSNSPNIRKRLQEKPRDNLRSKDSRKEIRREPVNSDHKEPRNLNVHDKESSAKEYKSNEKNRTGDLKISKNKESVQHQSEKDKNLKGEKSLTNTLDSKGKNLAPKGDPKSTSKPSKEKSLQEADKNLIKSDRNKAPGDKRIIKKTGPSNINKDRSKVLVQKQSISNEKYLKDIDHSSSQREKIPEKSNNNIKINEEQSKSSTKSSQKDDTYASSKRSDDMANNKSTTHKDSNKPIAKEILVKKSPMDSQVKTSKPTNSMTKDVLNKAKTKTSEVSKSNNELKDKQKFALGKVETQDSKLSKQTKPESFITKNVTAPKDTSNLEKITKTEESHNKKQKSPDKRDMKDTEKPKDSSQSDKSIPGDEIEPKSNEHQNNAEKTESKRSRKQLNSDQIINDEKLISQDVPHEKSKYTNSPNLENRDTNYAKHKKHSRTEYEDEFEEARTVEEHIESATTKKRKKKKDKDEKGKSSKKKKKEKKKKKDSKKKKYKEEGEIIEKPHKKKKSEKNRLHKKHRHEDYGSPEPDSSYNDHLLETRHSHTERPVSKKRLFDHHRNVEGRARDEYRSNRPNDRDPTLYRDDTVSIDQRGNAYYQDVDTPHPHHGDRRRRGPEMDERRRMMEMDRRDSSHRREMHKQNSNSHKQEGKGIMITVRSNEDSRVISSKNRSAKERESKEEMVESRNGESSRVPVHMRLGPSSSSSSGGKRPESSRGKSAQAVLSRSPQMKRLKRNNPSGRPSSASSGISAQSEDGANRGPRRSRPVTSGGGSKWRKQR